MTTLNPPEDVDLAKSLIKLHPWAQSVKYCRTGERVWCGSQNCKSLPKKRKNTILWISWMA